MRITHIAVAVSIALMSVAAAAKTESLGTLTTTNTTFGNRFWGWGAFNDYYTFSLGSEASAVGTTVSYDSILQDITLSSVSLQTWTGSAWADWLGTPVSPGKDFTPSEFSFSGLGGGDYRLAVAGKVGFQIDFSDPLKPASYQGTIRSIAAPAPEPGALGMALLGLMGVSFAALRRKGG